MTKSTCTQPGCSGELVAQGMCAKHYSRARKSGTWKPVPKRTPIERFLDKVSREDGCWAWLASTNDRGYGTFFFEGKHRKAHRWSYEHHVGPIPEGMEIDHICHNRSCVNPEHLRLATHQENTQYMRGANSANKSSGVRGVHARTDCSGWKVIIGHNGKNHYFGAYSSIAEAEEVAIRERAKLFTFPEAIRKAG